MLRLDVNKGVCMTITSKDLGGGSALTGVARKEYEDKVRKEQEMNEKLLATAILKIKEEQSKQLKKKKEPKKKKST
tara:strand:+ start:560 stop:787 length:228 start_codon:yes stop_codon:yes gene_type:complete